LYFASGSIGNMVFRQMTGGDAWVSGKPDFRRRKLSQDRKNTMQCDKYHIILRRITELLFTLQ